MREIFFRGMTNSKTESKSKRDTRASFLVLRLLIHCINASLLILIFIGIPAITSARFGNLQLSSAPKAHRLTLWGLALAAAANAIAAVSVAKGRKERVVCGWWVAGFLALLAVEYLHFNGYFNFNWLKQALLWVQSHF